MPTAASVKIRKMIDLEWRANQYCDGSSPTPPGGPEGDGDPDDNVAIPEVLSLMKICPLGKRYLPTTTKSREPRTTEVDLRVAFPPSVVVVIIVLLGRLGRLNLNTRFGKHIIVLAG
jgi:hypothetical protein